MSIVVKIFGDFYTFDGKKHQSHKNFELLSTNNIRINAENSEENNLEIKLVNFSEQVKVYNLLLLEWNDYLIEISGATDVEISSPNCEEIDKNRLYKFSYQNRIGKSSLTLTFNDNDLKDKYELNFDIVSKKLLDVGAESQLYYPRFYQNLLLSLYRYLSELPYEIKQATSWNITEGDKPTIDLFKAVFFKYNSDNLISAINTIIALPHKKPEEEEMFLRIDEVSEFDDDALLSIIEYPENLIESRCGLISNKSGVLFFTPSKLLTKITNDTFNTHENRFVKFCIKQMLNDLIELRKKKEKVIINNVYDDLQGVFETALNTTLMQETGEMNFLPYYSTVLQRRSGYSGLFKLYNEYLFSYQPFFDELERAIENRDVAKMYEYFCFFKLGEILGATELVIRNNILTSKSAIIFTWESRKFELQYEKYFEGGKESYSVDLNPDFSLFELNELKKLVAIFDAKYKFEIKDDKVTTAEKADIYKMHTYKDALNCPSTFICYPGERSEFFNETNLKETISPTELIEIIKNNNKCGVGFIQIIPNNME